MSRAYNFWVYILTNYDKKTLYVGRTNDLVTRLKEHYMFRRMSFHFYSSFGSGVYSSGRGGSKKLFERSEFFLESVFGSFFAKKECPRQGCIRVLQTVNNALIIKQLQHRFLHEVFFFLEKKEPKIQDSVNSLRSNSTLSNHPPRRVLRLSNNFQELLKVASA